MATPYGTTPIHADARARLRLVATPAPAPRATCASRHSAITRDLSSYSKYKRWAEHQRRDWPAPTGDDR